MPETRRRGYARRYCSPACRDAFWSAARRWVRKAVDTGLLPIAALKAPGISMHGSESASEAAE